MSKIHILPKEVAAQIAAGEVAERPASVVKELLENALDAGATKIILSTDKGGKSLISVEDDGCGMDREDAHKCFGEHATSKITNIDDIYHLSTFGFRGEALFAIASVGKVTLTTKTAVSPVGTEIVIAGGEQISLSDVARVTGTTIRIRDLFYNLPARLHYLKTDATEHTRNLKTFLSFALANPQVDFQFYANHRHGHRHSETGGTGDKLIYDLPKADFPSRAKLIFSPDFEKDFIKLSIDRDGISGDLYVPKMEAVSSRKNDQYIFVNQRFITDKIINTSIHDAYRSLLANPYLKDLPYIVMLNLQEVDINIHPRKLEVKFKNPQAIFSAVNYAIKSHFTAGYKIVESQKLSPPWRDPAMAGKVQSTDTNIQNGGRGMLSFNNQSPILPFPFKKGERGRWLVPPSGRKEAPRWTSGGIECQKDDGKEIFNSQPNFSFTSDELQKFTTEKKQRYFILRNSFLTLEIENGMRVIDLHALHERIIYEDLKSAMLEGNLNTQKLLLPESISLNAKQAEILRSHLSEFIRMGFEMDDIGHNTFNVNGLPSSLVTLKNLPTVLTQILTDIENEKEAKLSHDERLCKYTACRSALMFGESVQDNEIDYLLSRIKSLDSNITCPHGRPIYFDISYQEMMKKVGR